MLQRTRTGEYVQCMRVLETVCVRLLGGVAYKLLRPLSRAYGETAIGTTISVGDAGMLTHNNRFQI
jgi:hypothetical protein